MHCTSLSSSDVSAWFLPSDDLGTTSMAWQRMGMKLTSAVETSPEEAALKEVMPITLGLEESELKDFALRETCGMDPTSPEVRFSGEILRPWKNLEILQSCDVSPDFNRRRCVIF